MGAIEVNLCRGPIGVWEWIINTCCRCHRIVFLRIIDFAPEKIHRITQDCERYTDNMTGLSAENDNKFPHRIAVDDNVSK